MILRKNVEKKIILCCLDRELHFPRKKGTNSGTANGPRRKWRLWCDKLFHELARKYDERLHYPCQTCIRNSNLPFPFRFNGLLSSSFSWLQRLSRVVRFFTSKKIFSLLFRLPAARDSLFEASIELGWKFMAHARMSLIFAAGYMSLKYARMVPGNNCKSVTRPIKSCIGALNRYANFSFPKNHFGRTMFIRDVHGQSVTFKSCRIFNRTTSFLWQFRRLNYKGNSKKYSTFYS